MAEAMTRSLLSRRTAKEFDTVSAEFVRALRGKQSQNTLSRRLGFSSNVVYQWESGRRMPSLHDAMRVATICRSRPDGLAVAARLQTDQGRSDMIREMTIGQALPELADALEVSRSALSRWRSGSSLPTLSKFLQLLDLSTGRLLEFLNMFVDVAEFESLKDAWQRVSEVRALANLMPMFVPILCALELDDYRALAKHDDAWVGTRINLGRDEVKFAIRRMHEAGAIAYENERYVPVTLSHDLYLPALDVLRHTAHERIAGGFYAGTASHETVMRTKSELQLVLLRVKDMIEHDPGVREQIVVVSVQLARLGQRSQEGPES